MKPVACGNHVYSTGTLSSAATISAILFSKPSPLSLENGMLAGSAQTRSAVRFTRSTRCPSAANTDVTSAPANSATTSAATILLDTEARLLMLLRGRGLVCPLGRASAREAPDGAGLEVNIKVVDVAHHVGIVAERRHHAGLVGPYDLAAAGDNQHEIGIAHGLHRHDQARRVGRALAVGAVAHMAFGVISPIAREGVPVDRAVVSDVVGR